MSHKKTWLRLSQLFVQYAAGFRRQLQVLNPTRPFALTVIWTFEGFHNIESNIQMKTIVLALDQANLATTDGKIFQADIAESISMSMYSLGVSSTPCCSLYFLHTLTRLLYLSLSSRISILTCSLSLLLSAWFKYTTSLSLVRLG